LDFRSVIKEIGRGARGARGLEPHIARESFAALLNAEVDDVQLGAWWAAQRIKGETAEELHAFVEAMHDTMAWRIDRTDHGAAVRPLAVLPCYNGARQLPNLVPLFAQALAARGFDVLMHGVIADPARETTYSMCHALNLPIAETQADTENALRDKHIAFVPIGAIHPKLATLLSRRWQIGVRSAPHTVVKLLNPTNPTSVSSKNVLQVVALTHGDYVDRMAEYLHAHRISGAVFRGCEGEPVLHPKRHVTVQLFQRGAAHMHEWNGVATHDLPDTCDVATAVAYIQSVIDQTRDMPPWIDWLAQQMHSSVHEYESHNTAAR
jgi:anthranilate phosphoribosyltransferase